MHLFYTEMSSQYDRYCSYEPMRDLIDAYWDVDGKTMRSDITMEQRKERYAEIWKDFKDMSQSQFIEKVPQIDIMKYDYREKSSVTATAACMCL
ncbi:hypothetical protein NXW90_22540 [Bacteroides fragilis]|nr:hypothetical protein [Bacteroides fragilis]